MDCVPQEKHLGGGSTWGLFPVAGAPVLSFLFDFKWTASHLIAPLLPPYQADQVKCVYQAIYG